MRLTGLHFKEWSGPDLTWEIKPCTFSQFTLLTGDNAQGKSRLLNVLKFIKRLHTRSIQFPSPNLRIECELDFWNDDQNTPIEYNFEIYFNIEKNEAIVNDLIRANGQTIFDRKTNTLINEKTGEAVDSFFIPSGSPAISVLQDAHFKTALEVHDYLARMVFFDSLRFHATNTEVTPEVDVLRDTGANLASVLAHLKKAADPAVQAIENEFYDCFPTVQRNSLHVKKLSVPNKNAQAPVLMLTEKDSSKPIPQFEWAEGYLRALCLFTLAYVKAHKTSTKVSPSVILVDDFGVGLDYNTLTETLSFLQERAEKSQVMVATNDLLTSSMVPAQQWLVVKRKGTAVEARPLNGDLEEKERERRLLLQSNLDFYRGNVAKTHLQPLN